MLLNNIFMRSLLLLVAPMLVSCLLNDTLAMGNTLIPGQSLTSADGNYQLILTSSGALNGYDVSGGTIFWTANKLPAIGKSPGITSYFYVR